MSVFKRGNVWWYEFTFAGARIRQSSKSPVKAVCLQAERERRRELERGANHLEKAVKPKLFSGAVKAYLIEREAHWSPKTQVMHSNSLRHLEPHFGKMLLSEISAGQTTWKRL